MHVIYTAFIVNEESRTTARAKMRDWLVNGGESPTIVASLTGHTPITEAHVIDLYSDVLEETRKKLEGLEA